MKCRVCSCTENRACDPPCSWAEGEGDLCTGCAYLLTKMHSWQAGAHWPNIAALLRELRTWKRRAA